MNETQHIAPTTTSSSDKGIISTLKNYHELTKPRVVWMMILTSIVGMCLTPAGQLTWAVFFWGNIGIALAASAAAVVNHVVDHRIDCIMRRTQRRPIVQGKVSIPQALIFALVLCLLAMTILLKETNMLTAGLTFCTLVAYAGLYTMFLKRATSQNIVIGGIAGAAPPLLGWIAVTGHIAAAPLLLVLIIFVWTPPHFWALAIARKEEYGKADIPMLPNVLGVSFTKKSIFIYTLLLTAVTLLPFAIKMSGYIYLISVIILNTRFVIWSYKLLKNNDEKIPMRAFRYSITYLMLLFVALLVDHYFAFFM